MSRFFYITVATKPHEILNRIQRRVESQSETIIILGAEEKRDIGWNASGNFGVKLKEVRDFLLREDLSDDDIVLFSDAYDVIYQGNREEIIRRYLERFSKPIVFGCETTCNPLPSYEKYYTHKNCEFPYLNSGLFIGRVRALRQCIQTYEYNDRDDDQAFWTIQFLHTNKDLFALDYDNSLFLNTYGIDLSLIKKDGDVFTYKQSRPLFIHVNGPDKNELQLFIK
jgi:hypothetical protein